MLLACARFIYRKANMSISMNPAVAHQSIAPGEPRDTVDNLWAVATNDAI
jgi:hypothetical protein